MVRLLDLTREYLEVRRELDRHYLDTYKKSLGYELMEGRPFFPYEAIRDTILITAVMAILLFLTAFAAPPLNPPGNLDSQTEFIFPDWYLLWSFGILKLAEDIPVILAPGLPPLTPEIVELNALFWGSALSGVPFMVLGALPFIDRGKERRPVAAPFRAAFGIWGVMFIATQSMYSVNMIIDQQYFHNQNFSFPLLKAITYLAPFPVAAGFYFWLKSLQKGYEFKLNRCYQCWLCDDACPITQVTSKPFPKLNLIYNSYQKQFDGVGLWECLTCGACTAVCPEEIDYDSYVLYMRRVAMGIEKYDPKKSFVRPRDHGPLGLLPP
ncbi:MAG: 4Fe-4S dicluster domain-containing protein [Euryarchaeota archaeon]|nr:4Fe-4S dicluster domain-containing protein [Euryarchaeota archaeon]